MQYLINLTAYYNNTTVFYKISQISQYEYFAEPSDKNMRSFNLEKCAGVWISKNGDTNWQAAQIGSKIDKLNLIAVKN